MYLAFGLPHAENSELVGVEQSFWNLWSKPGHQVAQPHVLMLTSIGNATPECRGIAPPAAATACTVSFWWMRSLCVGRRYPRTDVFRSSAEPNAEAEDRTAKPACFPSGKP
ncbi:hypothetical protein [Burkholderia sp. Bp9099]|nr:hypothetical protein [Burkholderia sp. Bp9099]